MQCQSDNNAQPRHDNHRELSMSHDVSYVTLSDGQVPWARSRKPQPPWPPLWEDAGFSGTAVTGRPGLAGAIEAVERGEAQAVIVAKLDRLSRSPLDFAALMD
jgi:hypothetical protein